MEQLLGREGYDVETHVTLDSVAVAIDEQIGAILVTEEALLADLGPLHRALSDQPTWSAVPFVLLAGNAQRRSGDEAIRRRLPESAINVVLLERPLSAESLISAIASAMRARQKQFEMRDRIADLNESESRLRLATSAADIGTWDYDPVADVLRWDNRCKHLFGLSADAEVTFEGTFVAGLHPDDRAATVEAVGRALDPSGSGEYEIEYRTVGLEDGVVRWVIAKGGSIFENGRAIRFIGTIIDISARKASEAELVELYRTLEDQVADRTAALEAEMASRTAAEAALRQSQKMEAVGQLTGGIAHDFNNMLTGVIGALDIMKRRIASGRVDDLDRFMDAATTSAMRAAGLTARLLAFSRRQSLDTKPTDANALVSSLDDLLRRTIRENIALKIVCEPDIPYALADANQLESAILNLAINARDAMPRGGALTVETTAADLDTAYCANRPGIKPGPYVVVAVSDTGVGMDAAMIDKVFDPFFTTKPIGQGTGLGLSMVYGFAKQSGGQVRIHSSPGEGTSVKIFLPAASEGVAVADHSDAAEVSEGTGQRVLLVEDDDSVRMLVRDVLEELGYEAVEAAEPNSAVQLLESDARFDLMISDVGLPGMNGRQLAEIARSHWPDLPILFVTGYAENAAIRAGFLGTNMAMITKPFQMEVLSAKINEMLTAPAI